MLGFLPGEVDLRLLRSFVVLAEEQHFTRAAERLGVGQPVLSQRLTRLETQVGVALVWRDRRNFELTAAGVRLLRAARRALDEVERGIAEARAAL